MKKIRQGVFETNSSSTHSITIMTDEEYSKWSEEILWDFEEGKLIDKSKILSEIIKDNNVHLEEAEEIRKEYLYDYPQSPDEYMEDERLEVEVNNYISESGDKIIIISKYGMDN